MSVYPRNQRISNKTNRCTYYPGCCCIRLLAHFAEAIHPPVRVLPNEQTRELAEWVQRRHQIVEMLTAERNRPYPVCVVGIRFNPIIRSFYQRLRRVCIRDPPLRLREIVPTRSKVQYLSGLFAIPYSLRYYAYIKTMQRER
jgi:hypothetical protein